MSALKPCPFCGGKAGYVSAGPDTWMVYCPSSLCRTRPISDATHTQGKAHEHWNTRAPDPVREELVKALTSLVAHVDRGVYRDSAGLRLGEAVPQFERARAALAKASESQSTKSIGGGEAVANPNHIPSSITGEGV